MLHGLGIETGVDLRLLKSLDCRMSPLFLIRDFKSSNNIPSRVSLAF